MDNKTQEFLDRFPFFTLAKYADTELLGIVQNSDNVVVTMYIYNLLKTDEHKRKFIEAGEEWWWGSNRLIPINIVLKLAMKEFNYALRTFAIKDFTVIFGQQTSMSNIIVKRTKRRQISLVRKLD
jgi:hypothetical protein